jgi:pimeloyl-ACP methyl ester carboxylesterase
MKNQRFVRWTCALVVLAVTCGLGTAAESAPRELRADDGTVFILAEERVPVPEDRAKAGSEGTIELFVVRIGRSAARTRTAHVILAGGPGDSGASLVTGLARRGGASLLDMLDGDLVGIDQRGTGKSSPNLQTQALYGLPLDRPGSPETWLPLMEKTCREVAASFEERGVHLAAYNTRESADDIEDVRKALGYERVTLWGRSYGSHLALATLRQHPAAIDRVILANPEGPDDTFKLPSRVDAVLQRLEALVAADARAGKRVPRLTSLMRKVLARLEREPQSVEVSLPMTGGTARVAIGKFDVQWLTAQALGDPRSAATLPAAYLEMEAGDFRRIAQLVAVQRSRMGVQSAMKQMMDLSSGATPARRARIRREASASLLGNAINFPLMSLQTAWGNPDLGDDFRRPVRSKVPVLVLAGDLDPRTPVENGREIVRNLANGLLIVLANGGHHFDLFGSPQIRSVLTRFLRGEEPGVTKIDLPAPSFEGVAE